MNPLFAGIATALSRTLARHQGRPVRDARRLPLWRLLLDEVVYLAKRSLRPPWLWAWTSAAVAVAGVMVALDESTPGPVLSLGWRLVAAAAAGSAVAVLVRRWPGRGNG